MINSFDDCKYSDNLMIYCRKQAARQLLVTHELPDGMQVGRCIVLSITLTRSLLIVWQVDFTRQHSMIPSTRNLQGTIYSLVTTPRIVKNSTSK